MDSDPINRRRDVFGGTVTLHAGGGRESYLLSADHLAHIFAPPLIEVQDLPRPNPGDTLTPQLTGASVIA